MHAHTLRIYFIRNSYSQTHTHTQPRNCTIYGANCATAMRLPTKTHTDQVIWRLCFPFLSSLCVVLLRVAILWCSHVHRNHKKKSASSENQLSNFHATINYSACITQMFCRQLNKFSALFQLAVSLPCSHSLFHSLCCTFFFVICLSSFCGPHFFL